MYPPNREIHFTVPVLKHSTLWYQRRRKMASGISRVAVVFFQLVLLMTTTTAARDDVVFKLLNYVFIPNFINVQFTDDNFLRFYDCLCQGQENKCTTKHISLIGLPMYIDVEANDFTATNETAEFRFYKCSFVRSPTEEMMCERLDLDQLSSLNYAQLQSLSFHSRCSVTTCVQLLFSDPGERVTFNSDLALEQSCNSNCVCPSTTTARPVTTEVSTQTTESALAAFSKATTTMLSSVTNILTTKDNQRNAPEADGRSLSDERSTLGLIIGIVIAVLVIVLAILLGVILWRRRHAVLKSADRANHYVNVILPSPSSNAQPDLHNLSADVPLQDRTISTIDTSNNIQVPQNLQNHFVAVDINEYENEVNPTQANGNFGFTAAALVTPDTRGDANRQESNNNGLSDSLAQHNVGDVLAKQPQTQDEILDTMLDFPIPVSLIVTNSDGSVSSIDQDYLDINDGYEVPLNNADMTNAANTTRNYSGLDHEYYNQLTIDPGKEG